MDYNKKGYKFIIMANNNSIKILDRISAITLPKEWRERELFIKRYKDTIVIKKIEVPDFWRTWEKIKSFSKQITSNDIDKAIKWARKH